MSGRCCLAGAGLGRLAGGPGLLLLGAGSDASSSSLSCQCLGLTLRPRLLIMPSGKIALGCGASRSSTSARPKEGPRTGGIFLLLLTAQLSGCFVAAFEQACLPAVVCHLSCGLSKNMRWKLQQMQELKHNAVTGSLELAFEPTMSLGLCAVGVHAQKRPNRRQASNDLIPTLDTIDVALTSLATVKQPVPKLPPPIQAVVRRS